ncbi:ABC transporter ATP-binding protein [Neobacillus thermocopriae]|uniref:ABC transporter ATP-binding protein n=1 Tax=Neobacillus thermocopriae TaxID=1215031 RepID=A0A6B3TLT0_9BACI|nr:ABC transporter ATP-binding protein [Neobacillus thermocopriae]MED3622600.1 ABC transporter ATP-binding protein [Neobacillus thermocopriae]MED3714309.1 ABC transporter ATP-binding protein [Neobacillus thermocopriae]NEX77843.1 ABC transporter ATP-binding protein [Neobacillus thermocopriae]
MIEMKNVTKSFDRLTAIENVNLHIHKGSIYGLIGSNGAGKTTIIKLLAGIYLQEKGEVMIDGQPVFENVRLKQKLFYIPDQPYFFSQYTTKQMARFYRNCYPTWDEERFQNLINAFEVDINKKIQTFSKGWQRQIAFILAFSVKPEILILDEPMDGLDPVVRRKVKNLMIHDVAEREMTILISSHNLREIEDICDHIGVIHKGTLIMQKELDELKSNVHKVQIAYKDGVPEQLLNKLNPLHSEKRGSVHLLIIRGEEEIIAKHIRQTNPVIFDLLPLTLEEIFIYEMGDIGYAIKNVIV